MEVILRDFSHLELVQEMEAVAQREIGLPIKFLFELSSDGNLDIFRTDELQLTKDNVKRMYENNWLADFVEEADSGSLDDFVWEEDDILGQSHNLFYFLLEKTFGMKVTVAGVRETEDVVYLNIGIPVRSPFLQG